MQFYTRTKRPLTINIVSLIDILCILLIFFIVTTTFKKSEPEVEIKLPESTEAKETERTNEPIIIYATKDKKIFVGEEEVPLGGLTDALVRKKAATEAPLFALKADRDVPLGFFVKVLDSSKAAGLTNLSLYTEQPKDTE
jgi:biopolymer transport protein ExbD